MGKDVLYWWLFINAMNKNNGTRGKNMNMVRKKVVQISWRKTHPG